MDQRLDQRAVEVNWQNLALGHEVFRADGATFVRNRRLPRIYDANFVFGITASTPAAIERLLARAAREYAGAARVTFRADPWTPSSFEARLSHDRYHPTEALVLVLEGPLRGEAPRIQIRTIEDETGWEAYRALKRMDWLEYAARTGENAGGESIGDGLAAANRLKCPPVQYVLAYQAGRVVGHCSTWEGPNGVGQVEDLFVHPASRHRGIATALLRSCVEMARARGAGPVVIVADPTDTPKEMYAALGWRPLVTCRQYGKKNVRSA